MIRHVKLVMDLLIVIVFLVMTNIIENLILLVKNVNVKKIIGKLLYHYVLLVMLVVINALMLLVFVWNVTMLIILNLIIKDLVNVKMAFI